MSDDDAAKDNPNTDAAATAKGDRPQDSTAADVTAKFDSEQPTADADKADAAKTEAVKPADETVKLETASPTQTAPPIAETNSAERPSKGGSGTPWVPIAAAFVAGVLLVAAVTAIVVFWKQADDRGNELDARDSATRAACDFGRAVGTYDSKNLDPYFKQVNDLSTGEWGQFFKDATDTLKQAMTSVQARSKLDEIHCAWESGNENEANVVVILTQEQTNAAVPQPDKLTLPGVVHLEKKDGKWLVSKFDSPVSKGGPAGPIPGGEGQQPAPGTNPQSGQPEPSAPAPPGTTQPGR
ncbi:hypothetical protein [Nocardia transvalensis]|uniref:hypothetical protein n=1 Tax=Nocardia transvalensis TaxID=37333 RepID=UPI001895F9B3|nr:hypothetical protein [Nocardia transvalensis]MBF6328825.1 hypothetical protein [Nocardia transvalensis]